MISAVISGALALVGWYFSLPYAGLPMWAAILNVAYAPFAQWVASDRLGSAANLSVIIKFTLSLVGLAGTVMFWASFLLGGYWLFSAL